MKENYFIQLSVLNDQKEGMEAFIEKKSQILKINKILYDKT